MAEKNNHYTGAGSFLSMVSLQQAQRENKQVIVNIDINLLIANDQNFYGMRNIDELASMIALSNYVEPLTVTKVNDTDEKYLLVAGHRRLAAWKKLLEKGIVTDTTLPCVIRKFDAMRFEKDDGTEVTFDSKQIMFYYLMFSNMGQRKERTIFEQLREIRELEPFARAIYDEKLKDKDISGPFRKFFAQEFLKMSSSALQRKLSIEKLTDKVIQAIQDGLLSETAATTCLVNEPPEKQDQYIDDLIAGKVSGKVMNIREELGQKAKPEESSEEASPQETEDASPVEAKEEADEDTADEPSDFEPNAEEAEEPSATDDEDAPETEEPVADEAPVTPYASSAPQISVAPPAPAQPHRIPIPQNIGDPQEEANHWWSQVMDIIYENVKDAEEQEQKARDAGDEIAASQWGVRVSVAKYKIAIFQKAEAALNE